MSGKEDAARNARRAAALKDNLKRRKAQARARATPAAPAPDAPSADVMVRRDPGPPPGEPRTTRTTDNGPNAAEKR
jgi:hypothetical protein